MAARPDFLRTYDAQSFIYKDSDAPFVPPADYPLDDGRSARAPRIPPSDYNKESYGVKYPFRTYGDGRTQRHQPELVRTTYEASRAAVSPPPLPYSGEGGHAIVRRHTTRPAMMRSESPAAVVRPRSGSGLNKAFLHHLKNFDKFATIKGRAACCAECPICKAISVANVVLESEQEPIEASVRPKWHADPDPYPEDPSDPESFQKERRQRLFLRDMTRRGAKAARVTADRVARHVSELTVTNGEYVEVLDDHRGDLWWACSNVSGQLGYIPSNYLQVIRFDEFTLTGR